METEVYKSIDEVVKSKVVKLITNNDKIDDSIFYSKNVSARIKQQSDIDLVQKFFEQQKEQNNIFKKSKLEADNLLNEKINNLQLEYNHNLIVLEEKCASALLGLIDDIDN